MSILDRVKYHYHVHKLQQHVKHEMKNSHGTNDGSSTDFSSSQEDSIGKIKGGHKSKLGKGLKKIIKVFKIENGRAEEPKAQAAYKFRKGLRKLKNKLHKSEKEAVSKSDEDYENKTSVETVIGTDDVKIEDIKAEAFYDATQFEEARVEPIGNEFSTVEHINQEQDAHQSSHLEQENQIENKAHEVGHPIDRIQDVAVALEPFEANNMEKNDIEHIKAMNQIRIVNKSHDVGHAVPKVDQDIQEIVEEDMNHHVKAMRPKPVEENKIAKDQIKLIKAKGYQTIRTIAHKLVDAKTPALERKPKEVALVKEEGLEKYVPGGLHPVRIYEIYNRRYTVYRKLGWGQSATVWLVWDFFTEKFYAMKILAAILHERDAGRVNHEVSMLRHLRSGSRSSVGYKRITHLVDDFLHRGVNGTHQCLILPLMAGTLQSFANRWHSEHAEDEGTLPRDTMKKISIHLLEALDYAHTQGIVHTDIKPDNIFVGRKNIQEWIEREYMEQTEHLVRRVPPNQPYEIIASQCLSDHGCQLFDDPASLKIFLGDFGLGSWKVKCGTGPIQPLALRAPEVIMAAGWNETADLWSVGVSLHMAFTSKFMFVVHTEEKGEWKKLSLDAILAQHQFLFGGGIMPQSLLERTHEKVVDRIFDRKGRMKRYIGHEPVKFTDPEYTGTFSSDAKSLYVDWMHFLMRLEPNERPSIAELLRHPWLNDTTRD